MARRRLHPREAHHLRGRGGTPQLRQADIPADQHTMKKEKDYIKKKPACCLEKSLGQILYFFSPFISIAKKSRAFFFL